MRFVAGAVKSRSKRRFLVLAVITTVMLGAVAAVAIGAIRWRLQVVGLQISGDLPGVTLRELLSLIHPNSGQDNLARMITTRNPYAAIQNPHTRAADVRAGATIYRARCAVCHGVDGSGNGAAPALVGRPFKHGESDWGIYKTVQGGVAGSAMPAHPLPPTELWQLVAYIRELGNVDTSKHAGQIPATPAVSLPFEVLESTREPADEWLTYSGSYSSTRHSSLSQIDTSNVSRLALRWIHQFDGEPIRIEASPLVRDGVMFVTLETGQVFALNAQTGETIWMFSRSLPEDIIGGEAGTTVNRGVALLDDKVFVGTWDARIIALSTATGKVIWDTKVADHTTYYISGAPLAFRDLVVTGTGNMRGGRGIIVAYDAATGEERWRFTTVPGPGELGNDTWEGDSWQRGGAPTWMTGSYDPEKDMLFWGVGNPKPDFEPELRRGDNLYSNSVVALRGATGELLWHFQFTPADDKDWDSNQVPILAELGGGDQKQRSVLWGNRNGFYYVLDRDTGKFRKATAFVHQTWAHGIDSNGRPSAISKSARSMEGQLVYPGSQGATNWWAPSFDAELNLVFLHALEQGMVFYPSPMSVPTSTGKPFYTAVRALNPETGDLVWEYRHEPRTSNPVSGGLMTTKGKLLFGGDHKTFFALDSRSGKRLWSVATGGKICAAPITYMLNGQQYVVIAAGGDLLAFALPISAAEEALAPSRASGAM